MTLSQVRNIMQQAKEELYSSPQDAAEFLCDLASEPGMFYEYNLDPEGRLVDVYWASAYQQENCARYGGCIQLDTTVFVCRSARRPDSTQHRGNFNSHSVIDVTIGCTSSTVRVRV